jgi:hypothetical protein
MQVALLGLLEILEVGLVRVLRLPTEQRAQLARQLLQPSHHCSLPSFCLSTHTTQTLVITQVRLVSMTSIYTPTYQFPVPAPSYPARGVQAAYFCLGVCLPMGICGFS